MNKRSTTNKTPARTPAPARHGIIRRVVFTVIAAMTILVISLIWIVHRATRKITVNRATTFVTGPLRPDGTINYAAAYNIIAGRGVTARNNAAIPLLRVFGVDAQTLGKHWARVANLMGLKTRVRDGTRFLNTLEYFNRHPKAKAAMLRAGHPTLMVNSPLLADHVWRARQYPLMARYLRAQRAALAAIRKAVEKPRFFIPAIRGGRDGFMPTGLLIDLLLQSRNVAFALTADCNLMVGQKRFGRAAADLLALRRLAALLTRRPLMISNLEGLAESAWATNAEINIALTRPDDIALFRRLLRERPPVPRDMSQCLNFGDRFDTLAALTRLRNGGGAANAIAVIGGPRWLVDWNWIFRRLNGVYTAYSRAAAADTYDEAETLAAPAERAMQAARDNQPGWAAPTASAFHRFVKHDFSPIHRAFNISFTEFTAERFATTIMALNLYKAAHHAFPMKLSALCPKYLPHIGVDAFDGKPPIYTRTSSGYILRSAGPFGHLMQRPRSAISERLLIRFPPFAKAELDKIQFLRPGQSFDGLRKAPANDYYGTQR